MQLLGIGARRIKVNKKIAAQILLMRFSKVNHYSAVAVGKIFGVSEKVVRDIWKGRTWTNQNSQVYLKRSLAMKSFTKQTDSTAQIKLGGNILYYVSIDPLIRGRKIGSLQNALEFPRLQSEHGIYLSMDILLHAWEQGTLQANKLEDPFSCDWKY